MWKSVESYELKGEIFKANSVVDKICKLSKKKDNNIQLIKSFIYQSKFNQVVIEDSRLNFIKRIETEIDQAQAPTKNILEHIYVKFLKEVYNKERYKIGKRSKVNEPKSIYYWAKEDFDIAIKQHIEASVSFP